MWVDTVFCVLYAHCFLDYSGDYSCGRLSYSGKKLFCKTHTKKSLTESYYSTITDCKPAVLTEKGLCHEYFSRWIFEIF